MNTCGTQAYPFTPNSLHKKWSLPLRISSVNVTKSAENCGFGHIYWKKRKFYFLCSDWSKIPITTLQDDSGELN